MGIVTVGEHTYGLPLIRRGTHNSITIGKYCSIAQDVIWDGGFSHNYKNVTTYPFNPNWKGCGHLPLNLKEAKDIVVGNDVWIGEGSIIMSGVNIGDGAVIGARSIVTADVLPYQIWVGSSKMQKVRFRFEWEQMHKLLEIKWWNWPDEKVRENLPLLLSENIDDFINKHYDH